MRTYWKLQINYSRAARKYRGHDLFFYTDKPLTDATIPLEAVADQMMHPSELAFVDSVMQISKQEYSKYMWE